MEGALLLQLRRDPIENQLVELADLVALAQHKDG